ncbi:MAG TPA: hypothetical protein PKK95_06530 [Vicinamibacterales bacterium]|mgnify:FL=1|nr:hypothetical protein [Vicinamibacterales bacterium]
MDTYLAIAPDVKLGKDVKLARFINLYGCEIGDETKIGAFVEIQKNAKVGRRCKISSHTFICEGVTIEDNVFIGHGVTFINDTYPRATTEGLVGAGERVASPARGEQHRPGPHLGLGVPRQEIGRPHRLGQRARTVPLAHEGLGQLEPRRCQHRVCFHRPAVLQDGGVHVPLRELAVAPLHEVGRASRAAGHRRRDEDHPHERSSSQ